MKKTLRILLAIFAVIGLVLMGRSTAWWFPIVVVVVILILSKFIDWVFKKDVKKLDLIEMDDIRGDFYWNKDGSVRFDPGVHGNFVIRRVPEL